MTYLEHQIKSIINNFPKYENFITNYFKKYKYPFFKDNSLDYYDTLLYLIIELYIF